MKVTHLNYSAIMNANAARANANSARISVEAQKNNNNMVAWNNYFIPAYKEAVKKQETADTVITHLTTLANIGLKAMQLKDQADGEEASNAVTDAASTLGNAYNREYQNNVSSFFDADNNIVKPQAIIDQENALRESIQGMSISNERKKQATDALERMFSSAWDDVGSQLQARELQSRNTAWLDRRKEALDVDVALGTEENGISLIDNTGWFTPSEREQEKSNYREDYRTKRNSYLVSNAAKTEGYSTAKDLIPTLDTVNQDEIDYLDDLAYSIANNESKKNIADYSEMAKNQLANGESPRVVLDAIELELEEMKDESRKEDILSAVDNIIYSNGLKSLGLSAGTDITEMTVSELDDLKENFDEQRDMLFPGERLKASTDALSALISGQYDKIASSNAADNIETQEHALAMVMDGTMSPKDAAAVILEAYKSNDSDKSDEIASHENLAKLYSYIVPAHLKDYNKQREESFEDLYAASMKLDSKKPEELREIKGARMKAHQYILGRFASTPGDDITQDMVDKWWDEALDLYTGEAITFLEAREETGKLFVQQDSMELSSDRLREYTNLALNAPEGTISINSDETISAADPLYLRAYEETASIIRTAIDKGGYGDIEESTASPLRVNGVDKPIAVVRLKDRTEFTLLGAVLFTRPEGSDAWDIIGPVTAIEGMNDPYFEPGEMHRPLVSTESPYNILPDGEGGFIDETELTPDENSFLSHVTSLEKEGAVNQPEASSGALIPVSEISEDAVAEIQEEEPDIPVRRVQGVGPEFWYRGKWYLLDKLPENSEVLAAYDRFNSTFDGTWPKVWK